MEWVQNKRILDFLYIPNAIENKDKKLLRKIKKLTKDLSEEIGNINFFVLNYRNKLEL